MSAKERVNMLVDENTKLQQKLQTAMAAMERAQVRWVSELTRLDTSVLNNIGTEQHRY